MRLWQLNFASILALFALCAALVGAMSWGLSRLQSNAAEVQHYFTVREAVGGALRGQIEQYLRGGDSEQLAASLDAIDLVANGLGQLDAATATAVRPQLDALRTRLDTEMRAAGKIAGNPQALLLQAEAELRDALGSLQGLAQQVDDSALTINYLRLTGDLSRAVQELALARERFAEQGGTVLADNVRFRIGEAETLVKALQALPPLGIASEQKGNSFEAMLWAGNAGAEPAQDKSVRLREELAFVLGRYPKAFDYTQSQAEAVEAARGGVREAVAGLLTTLAGAEETLLARQQQIRSNVQWTLWSLVLAVTLIGCLLCGVQRHLGRMLTRVAQHLHHLAEGDLSASLAVRSPLAEVGLLRDSAGRLQQTLADVIDELQRGSVDITAAAGRVLASASDLAQRQERQHEQSVQAADAALELSAASERVATAAGEVTASTDSAAALIAQNTAVIEAAVNAVGTLSDEVAATGAALLQLRDDAEQVQGFVTDIRSIADRTNLLALNAAIEAARAGEQGRGFAVVADEVRQLAGRSSDASAEIGVALERISSSSSRLAQALARQERTSRDTVDAASSAGVAQAQLVDYVSDIRCSVARIAAQAQSESHAVTEMTAFVDSVATAAAGAAQQAAAGVHLSQALQQTGERVAELSRRFRLG